MEVFGSRLAEMAHTCATAVMCAVEHPAPAPYTTNINQKHTAAALAL